MVSPGALASHGRPAQANSHGSLPFILAIFAVAPLALDHLGVFQKSLVQPSPAPSHNNIASYTSIQSPEPTTYFKYYVLYMKLILGFFYGHAIPFLFNVAASVIRWLAHPPLILVSISLALLAPIGFFVRVILLALVQTPWSWVKWLADLLYPVYMFFGVAALAGASLGLCGAGFAKALLLFLGEAWSSYLEERVDGEVEAYQEEVRLAKLRRRLRGKRRARSR
jgi:hypothetical protein